MAGWLLALLLTGLGCGGTCPGGTNVSTLGLHAELSAATVFVGDVMTGDNVGDAHAWHLAIDDASAATGGSGIVNLVALDGEALSLRLPFPLSTGQALSITGEVSLAARGMTFTFGGAAGDATVVGAWLALCPPGATDLSCNLAERKEVVDGSLRVESVRPLRVHVTADVSYGDATALAPVTLDGDLVFAATEGTRCLD